MMKTFEEYEAEAAWEAHLENALRHARRQAAERRRKAIRGAVLLWAAVALVLAALWLARETGEPEPEAPTVTAGRLAGDQTPAVEYTLMLDIIRKETGYRNVKGDGEASWGYCQVQPRWHKARMERLGVTDLMDPFGNFRVACDYMAELLSRYDVENALTAYNSGHPGHSAYARTVMGYWEELKNG